MKNYKLLQIQALLFFSAACFGQSQMKPEETEVWDPEPIMVDPGIHPFSSIPSDAIPLFDGTDLKMWKKFTNNSDVEKSAEWKVENGEITIKPGSGAIETKQQFGNVQLHIEWLSPTLESKSGQGYSNSGIFFMGIYEVQILNSYDNRTYSNGQAGSIYKQHIPLVNASKKPGEWQTYDIVFKAPVFNQAGQLISPATITAFHNGVLIQNHSTLSGPTKYIGFPKYEKHPDKLSLRLQDHGDPVKFRNIWIREL